MVKINKDAYRHGVYGASGSGKSTLIKTAYAHERRRVAFDPMDEYHEQGFVRVSTIKGLTDAIRRRWQSAFSIAYVPRPDHEIEDLHHVSKRLAEVQEPYWAGKMSRKVTFIVEELNLGFPNHSLPKGMGGFANLCSRGRHYGINIIGASQRIAEVGTRFRGNCSRTYFFFQDELADVETICRSIGREWKAELEGLQVHEYLVRERREITKGRNRI